MEEKVWEEDSDEEVGKEKKEGESGDKRLVYVLAGWLPLLACLLTFCMQVELVTQLSLSL